jgi:hypothetical protein
MQRRKVYGGLVYSVAWSLIKLNYQKKINKNQSGQSQCFENHVGR